jgi:hypothetical protein
MIAGSVSTPSCYIKLRSTLFAKHLAHKVDGVLRAEFPHDIRTVKFDSARADAEPPRVLEAPLTI